MKYIFKNSILFGLVLMMIAACDFEAEFPRVAEYPEMSIGDFSPKTGKPNELITITGTNFGDYPHAVTVIFNNIESNDIVSISDTEIQVRVPSFESANLATGPLTLKVWDVSDTFADEFVALEGATLIGITPERGQAGDQVVISGTNFGTDADIVNVTFSGDVEADILLVNDTTITLLVPEGAETGTVVVEISPEIFTTAFLVGGVDFGRVEAETFSNSSPAIQTEACADPEDESEDPINVGYINPDSWISFDGVFLEGAESVTVRAASGTSGGTLEFRLDATDGELIGSMDIVNTGGWQAWQDFKTDLDVSSVSGGRDLYMVFTGTDNYLFNINWFQFTGANQKIEAEDADEFGANTVAEACSDVEDTSENPQNVGYVTPGSYLRYDGIFLDGISGIAARVASGTAGGTMEFRLGAVDGDLIGSIDIANTTGWQSYVTLETDIVATEGGHTLYVVNTGTESYLYNINWFELIQ